MTKRKLVKGSLELPEDIKIVQIDASESGELFPVEDPDAAMCDFFKDQMKYEVQNREGIKSSTM